LFCRIFEDEEIKGYLDPRIDVYLSPQFQPMADIGYEEKSQLGANPVDITQNMKEAFEPSEMFMDKASFCDAMRKEPVIRVEELGEDVAHLELQDSKIVVYTSNLSSASDTVKLLHSRIEPLLLFFIDAAQSIDASDSAWEVLLMVEVAKDGSVIKVVGMATIYAFYVFPDKRRYRLSQVLIMPPYQGQGYGSLMIDAVFALARKTGVVDITVGLLHTKDEPFERLGV